MEIQVMTEKNDTSRLTEKYIFRNIRQEEIAQAAEIEKICFPPNEACSYEHMEKRVDKAPELFLVAEDRATGRIAAWSFVHRFVWQSTESKDL